MVCWILCWSVFVISAMKATVHGTRHDLDVYSGYVIPDNIKWSYGDNPLGPENWPELFPIKCAGTVQSPIDISTMETVHNPYLRRLMFTAPSPGSTFVVHNTGKYNQAKCRTCTNVQVNTEGNFFMYGGGLQSVYKIEQFHFHWGDSSHHGAEHTIDGVEYPIEMHIVGLNTDYASVVDAGHHPDGFAVLGVLFEVSMYDNPVLEPIIQAIPHVLDPDWNNHVMIASTFIRNLLPYADHKFYRYQGSLTTPICLETVIWTVFEQKLPISERQLNIFRQALTPSKPQISPQESGNVMRERLVNNFRPVQPLHGRTVYRSFLFSPTASL